MHKSIAPNLNQYKLPMTPEIGHVLDKMQDQIAKEEDRRIMKIMNNIIDDFNFVNRLGIEELPLYINHIFKTNIGYILVAQRLKSKGQIDNKALNDIIMENLELLSK